VHALRSEKSLEALSRKALGVIVDFVGAPMGAILVSTFDTEETIYRRLASFEWPAGYCRDIDTLGELLRAYKYREAQELLDKMGTEAYLSNPAS
jgi:Iap family predicted aminopeptidase